LLATETSEYIPQRQCYTIASQQWATGELHSVADISLWIRMLHSGPLLGHFYFC